MMDESITHEDLGCLVVDRDRIVGKQLFAGIPANLYIDV